MSLADKVRNKLDALRGHTKEQTGKATGDRGTRVEGYGERASADLRDAGEKTRDAFRR